MSRCKSPQQKAQARRFSEALRLAKLERKSSAAESFAALPSDGPPPNSTPDSPEPYRLSSLGVGDITHPGVLTSLECCEIPSGSGGRDRDK